jgi:hypothetical protein
MSARLLPRFESIADVPRYTEEFLEHCRVYKDFEMKRRLVLAIAVIARISQIGMTIAIHPSA